MNIEETQVTESAENNQVQETPETTQENNQETQEQAKPEETKAAEETNSTNQETASPEEKTPDKVQDAPPSDEPKAAEKKQNEKKEAPAIDQAKIDELFNELKERNARNEVFEVSVKSRIRGGLRVMYNEMPLFLPSSHFSLKRSPSEQDLTDSIGSTLNVLIHEMQELDEGRKAIIVSRKQILMNDFWGQINVGDKVLGKVSSVASFGVFVDLGGVEGLIHISRLSQMHIEDPNTVAKKGDKIEAVVVELDREKNRIALSRKELEESPWKQVAEEFQVGSQHKGIVRRLTDFGAYVELKPGVDGLLRTAEISWTKRIKKPSDVFQPGQEIMVEIIAVSEEKHTVTLSYKRTQPNPWEEIAQKYPVSTEISGVVSQIMPQGVIVTIADDIDGFMPRSKMRNLMQGKKVPFQQGEKVDVIIADLIPAEESLILAPNVDEAAMAKMQRDDRPKGGKNFTKMKPAQPSINLGDLLSEQDRKTLFGSVDE